MENGPEIIVGNREVYGGKALVGIPYTDLRQHVYMIGKSGSGKTTLLRHMILQAIEVGEGVGILDPHGDLAEELLNCIPPSRVQDVVYFNPADEDFPIAFNVLRANMAPHLVASGLVSAAKSLWSHSWGPRLEYILYATLAALIECENVSLLSVPRMLIEPRYRNWVMRQVQDPMVKLFWEREFENYERRFAQEAVSPVQNKIGQLLMSPQLRNILGQVPKAIDPRFMMDRGRIFIANLSKGKIGEDKSNLLGAFLVAQFHLAAMSRANVAESERRDFRLFVDEFQSFGTDSFASILSEARKYRLSLTLSHQYIDQLSPELRGAVFGNVGSLISFRVGESDAEVLEREFGRSYPASNFSHLGNHQILAKLLVHGMQQEPFAATTLPPGGVRHGRRDKIIRNCRERFGSRREVVEERIRKWLER